MPTTFAPCGCRYTWPDATDVTDETPVEVRFCARHLQFIQRGMPLTEVEDAPLLTVPPLQAGVTETIKMKDGP